jgi:hypothetical protein
MRTRPASRLQSLALHHLKVSLDKAEAIKRFRPSDG